MPPWCIKTGGSSRKIVSIFSTKSPQVSRLFARPERLGDVEADSKVLISGICCKAFFKAFNSRGLMRPAATLEIIRSTSPIGFNKSET